MERMSPEEFLAALSQGRSTFHDLTLTASLVLQDVQVKGDLDIDRIAVEGDLTVRNVFVLGTLHVGSIKAGNITFDNFNATAYR